MNLLMFRQACANMQMLSADSYLKRVRHRGKEEKVIERIGELFKQTGGFVEMFSKAWSAARSVEWNGEPTFEKAITTYAHQLNKRHLHAIGDKDVFALTLASFWMQEPGGTIADLVNGVTRYARTGSVTNSGKFALDRLETEASNLMTLPASAWIMPRAL